MKRMISGLTAVMIFLSLPLLGRANEIFRDTHTETIVRGVTRTDVSKHMGSYRLTYHYICADFTEEHLALDLLKSEQGVDVLEKVSTLSECEPGTVAAINADFFSWFSGGLGFSLGMEMKDGELLASPIEPDKMATALVSKDGTVDFSYLQFQTTVTAPNGESHPIRHINKHTTYYGDVILYTHDFNHGKTPAPGGNAIEVVVTDGIVTDIRIGQESVTIPENGYVLASDIGMNGFLNNNFSVGDRVLLTVTATPDLEEIKTAFGGGTLLVKDGSIPKFTHEASGYQPRSAIGVDSSGTKVFLVAVDGRQSASRGMTQTELAKLMLELGCFHAMNLDGGGSTRLLAASNDSSLLTVANSPTEDRKVINAVGVVSSAGIGAPHRLEAKAPQTVILSGDTVPLICTVYDEYDHLVPPNDSITWGMSGTEGEMRDSSLHPTAAGIAYASAFSGDLSSNPLSFSVIDSISGISLPGNLSISIGEAVLPEINVFSGGTSAKVYTLDPFKITANENILRVENGRLIGVSQGVTPLTFSYGNVSTTVLAAVGSPDAVARLPQNQYHDPMTGDSDSGFVFRVGARNKEETCLADITNAKINAFLSAGDCSAFLGCGTPEGNQLTVGKLARKDASNCLFMSLDIRKGGIMSTDSNEWDTIDNAMKNSFAHHVFFILDQPMSAWTDQEEKETFIRYLSLMGADRNIFVISPGDRNTLNIIDNVRYFTVADSAKGADTYEKITSLSCLSFSVNGGDISYRWIPLYE